MKILIVCNYYQPQFGYSESKIAESLVSLGHTVEILTGDSYFPFPDYDSTVKAVLGPRKVGVGKTTLHKIPVTRQRTYLEFFARSLFFGIKEKIVEYHPDVVIVFGISTPACVQVALAKKSHHFTFLAVDSHLPSEFQSGNQLIKNSFYAAFRFFFSKLINTSLDVPIAVQEDTTPIIKKYYGVTKKCALISHGTDCDFFKPSSQQKKTQRKRMKISESAFIVLYTGKIIPSKGVHLLCEAFSILKSKYAKNDLHLVLVGDGPSEYKESCLKACKKYTKLVHITGMLPQTELPSFYAASDVAVWPLQESLAMLDAAASQIPFIANDTLGARERIKNDNALLYKVGNVIDLAKKIELLMINPKLKEKMGIAGRTLVESKFSWKQRAQEYVRLAKRFK